MCVWLRVYRKWDNSCITTAEYCGIFLYYNRSRDQGIASRCRDVNKNCNIIYPQKVQTLTVKCKHKTLYFLNTHRLFIAHKVLNFHLDFVTSKIKPIEYFCLWTILIKNKKDRGRHYQETWKWLITHKTWVLKQYILIASH